MLGVDLAARLLDRARTKAIKYGLTNIEFRLADMTALGYGDGRFDAVVSVFSIFFVPDWRITFSPKTGGQRGHRPRIRRHDWATAPELGIVARSD